MSHPPLLTYKELNDRITSGDVDRVVARTALSYWIGPSKRDAEITAFVTADRIMDGLADAVYDLREDLSRQKADRHAYREVAAAYEWITKG